MTLRYQINDQLAPRRAGGVRLAGLGASASASVQAALNLGPEAATAWNGIQATMQNEGWGAQDIDNAANSFVQTYNQLNQGNILGSGGDPVAAAAGLVSVGSTIAGAASTVVGLASAASSGSVPKALNAVMGMVAAAVPLAAAAGAFSFGVGAAIVVGLEIVSAALSGLFGSPTPPEGSVGNCAYYGSSGPPTIVDNYVWSWPAGGIVGGGPGNGAWRRFPDPSNSNDSGWFTTYQATGVLDLGAYTQTWWWTAGSEGHTDLWYACFTLPQDSGKRPIDQACYSNGASVYHHLECETVLAAAVAQDGSPAAALATFQLALFAALKANWEYGLNGLTQRPDWEVLQQTLILWNNAHSASQTIAIQPSNSAPLGAIAACPSAITPYASILLGQSSAKMGGSFMMPNGGAKLSVGPIKTAVEGNETVGWGPGSILFGVARASSSTASTTKTVAIGAAAITGASLLAAFLYARHNRTTTRAVLKTAWQKTGGKIHVPHHLPKLLGRKR